MNDMLEVLEPDFIFVDERGSLTQLVHNGYKQVNVITAKAGCFRGGHYHKFNKEAFYIITGEILLKLRKGEHTAQFSFSNGDMFAISSGVTHGFEFIKDTLLVSMYDKGVEISVTEKDIFQD